MTAAHSLSLLTLDSIKQSFKLTENHSNGDQPWKILESSKFGPVGSIRLFEANEHISKMVYVSIGVEAFQLDSHMIFAFTNEDSPLPHFTLDSVATGPHYAYHLDLIPKVDLGSNLQYMKEIYQPITEVFENRANIEGLSPAVLSPIQLAVMSPWMLANRATESAFDQVGKLVSQYLVHWTDLVKNGPSAELKQDLAKKSVSIKQRDTDNRAMLFSKEIDPVWDKIEPLIGAESGELIRNLLKKVN